MVPLISGLLLTLLTLLAVLVLVGVAVCLLLTAMLALVLLLERTGTDVPRAVSEVRDRLRDAGASGRGSAGGEPGARLPWSRRTPSNAGAPAPGAPRPAHEPVAQPARTPDATATSDGADPEAPRVAQTPARAATTTARARTARAAAPAADRLQDAEPAAGDGATDAPTERIPVAPSDASPEPATRTRPIRKPRPTASAEPDADRAAAMERLFAPLTESDRTEPLPRAEER